LVWGLTELIVTHTRRAGAWGRRREKEIREKSLRPPIPAIKTRKRTYRFGVS